MSENLLASALDAFLGSKLELRSYRKKRVYDDERKMYKELMKKITPAVGYTSALFPTFDSLPVDEFEREQFIKKRYSMAFEAQLAYWMFVQENRPFWDDNLYKKLEDISEKLRMVQIMYTWKFFVESQKIAAMSAEKEYQELCLSLREDSMKEVSNFIKEKIQNIN